MADPFVAEIRIFPFNFAPKGWAFCDGQLLPLSQNTALFSLLGTTYGGDGKSTFALPNLQGSTPMFWGQGSGLSDHVEGEAAGEDVVTLLESEIPAHAHALSANSDSGDLPSPGSTRALARSSPFIYKQPAGAAPVQQMAPEALAPAGSSLPHNNLQPYLTLNFCIALQGVFPPRS
jgi:microcystin-dependent protein